MAESTEAKILAMVSAPATRESGYRLMVRTYQEALYWRARQLVGSHEDADDVLQEALVKACRGLSGFQGEARLSTWLYRIVTNEALTWLRKRKRRIGNGGSLMEEDSAASLEADCYVGPGEAERLLAESLATLPDRQAQVFRLRYYEELSYEELSARLGVSVGALKASYHHAAKKIEAYIRQQSG